MITFEQAGPAIAVDSIIELPKSEACMKNGVIIGNIDILDIRFGNLWTNIDRSLFKELGVQYGDSFVVTIENETGKLYQNVMTFGRSFTDSHVGEPLIFVNSLDKLGIAINQGSFAEMYHIEPGINRKIIICKS